MGVDDERPWWSLYDAGEPGLTYAPELVRWFDEMEICDLDGLAEDCAQDGRWTFMYAAAPLHIVKGTGSPVNPIAIR